MNKSIKRKQRYKRAVITGIKPGTPERNCIHQTYDDEADRVRYYHVTKGWRTRRAIQPSWRAISAVLKRCRIK